MPNPIALFLNKPLQSSAALRFRQRVMGLAEDFWRDGPHSLFALNVNFNHLPAALRAGKTTPHGSVETQAQSSAAQPKPGPWHAEPGEISEKMWGDGFVVPGSAAIDNLLLKPLGLTRDMNVLDLSAGLGGRVRCMAEESGASITGLEPDAAIAARGMQLSLRAGKGKHASIAHYDPAHLALDRSYDCVIARETFYRVPERPVFFAAIGQHTKPRAQIAFTDYVLDPEHAGHPAVLAWKKYEVAANPMGLVETAEMWAKVGFTLRVHEDMTDFYTTEVREGLKRLMVYLASGVRPDAPTASAILRRIQTWKYRLAAIDAGMKFYRFYGTK